MTNRPSTMLLHLTPHLLARIEALGFEVGSEGVLPWLVGKAEEMRAECDKMAAAGRTVVEATDEMRAQWAEIEERLTAERVVETHRHEAAMTRLSAVRTALLDETDSAPAVTDPPDVWSRAIRVAVCGAKMLAEEAEELRRSEAALLYRPEGGADLGFEAWSEGWVKQVGEPNEYGETDETIVIEDFSACAHPEGDPYRRSVYHKNSLISCSFYRSPRAAMKAGS